MDSAWESWIRPLLLIAVAGTAGALWWFEVLPDRLAAIGLLVLGWAFASLAIWQHAATLDHSEARGQLTGALLVAAGLMLAWSPWMALSPAGLVGKGVVQGPDDLFIVDKSLHGVDDYAVHVHGTPAGDETSASMRIVLKAARTADHVHEGHLRSSRPAGPARTRTKTGQKKHDVMWRVTADLTQGASVRVEADDPMSISWPVDVELRHTAAPRTWLYLVGVALFLVAAFVDATDPVPPKSRSAVLIAGVIVFAPVFDQLYAPTNVTKAVFGAGLVGALVGGFIGVPFTWLVGALWGGRRGDADIDRRPRVRRWVDAHGNPRAPLGPVTGRTRRPQPVHHVDDELAAAAARDEDTEPGPAR